VLIPTWHVMMTATTNEDEDKVKGRENNEEGKEG
jgi:hypothetical protein